MHASDVHQVFFLCFLFAAGPYLQLVGVVMALSGAVYLYRLGFSFEQQSKGLYFCSELHLVNVV